MNESGGQEQSGYDMRVRHTRISIEMQILRTVISKRMKLANDASLECEVKDLISSSVCKHFRRM